MKRFVVCLLMVLYMAGAMGATVHLHYCMGEFVNASLIHHEEHKCDKCGMVKKTDDNGCCKDEHKTFKTAEHNKVTPSLNTTFHYADIAAAPVYVSFNSVRYYECAPRSIAQAHAPPDQYNKTPIYLQIRNLRI